MTPSTCQTLRSVLDDLEIRSQVEDCVRGMVADVEMAHTLQTAVQHEWERQAWQATIQAQQQALDESYWERQQLRHESLPLADGLVRDLYQTSRELGKYYQLKTQHSTLAQEYDELLAKLLQAEDQIRFLEEEKDRALQSALAMTEATQEAKPVATAPATAAVGASKDKEPNKPHPDEVSPTTDLPVDEPNTEPLVEATKDATTETPTPVVVTEQVEAPAAAANEETPPPPPAAAAVVVSLEVEAANETNRMHLADFEDVILMNIFSFLDALEILNTSLINTKMYSRVDTMFGLGDAGTDNTTIATEEEGSTIVVASTNITQPVATKTPASVTDSGTTATLDNSKNPPPRSNSVGDTPSTTASTTATATTTTATTSTPFTPSRGSPTNPFLPTTTQQQASAVMNNVLQMFQPRPSAAVRGGNTTPTRRGAPIMNAATASSVAAKLSDAELNAILGMMERMRQKEAAVERLKAENEQVRAELEGTQSVKDFLVSKVRDMEELLTRREEDETKVAQQIASDQEVIAFLDGRVQELERELTKMQASRAESNVTRQKLQSNLEQKTTVLQDMLQFERERFVEFEKESKSTKKLLVKEIKLCRNQIIALTAERDALKEQNQTLQKAVLHTAGSNASGMERIYA